MQRGEAGAGAPGDWAWWELLPSSGTAIREMKRIKFKSLYSKSLQ